MVTTGLATLKRTPERTACNKQHSSDIAAGPREPLTEDQQVITFSWYLLWYPCFVVAMIDNCCFVWSSQGQHYSLLQLHEDIAGFMALADFQHKNIVRGIKQVLKMKGPILYLIFFLIHVVQLLK